MGLWISRRGKESVMYYRRLPAFEYLAPRSLGEALDLLRRFEGKASVTAGGTIVLHSMKERTGVRKALIGLKAIPNLDRITFAESAGLRVGCMATLQSVADSPEVRHSFQMFSTSCGKLRS